MIYLMFRDMIIHIKYVYMDSVCQSFVKIPMIRTDLHEHLHYLRTQDSLCRGEVFGTTEISALMFSWIGGIWLGINPECRPGGNNGLNRQSRDISRLILFHPCEYDYDQDGLHDFRGYSSGR